MLITKKMIFFVLEKILYKDEMAQQFMQKNCTKSILLKKIKNFVYARIIMEQTVIYLLMVQKSKDLKQKTLKLRQVHYV